MLELLLTSFPAVIRYFQLKRRGEAITVWTMRGAVLLWAILAFLLFMIIFYFHPKSYSGLLPYRTISVVAQTSGPVTGVNVQNGQRVEAGDLLFTIEDSTQRAALAQAEAELGKLSAAETQAEDSVKVAEAGLKEAQTALAKLADDLQQAQTLVDRGVGTVDRVQELEAAFASAEAGVDAARAQLDQARSNLETGVPAQIEAAQAAVQAARVALEKTQVRAFSSGTITQLALSTGSPASTLILSPAMVIIPERDLEKPLRLTAGFSQVARSTLYEGMPAEVACDTNLNISFRNAVFPARVAEIQPAIATGQIVPSARVLEPANAGARGSMLVYLELDYPEHAALMLDGSGCLVQTYSNDLPGAFGHIIAATGIVKAAGLRLKVWGALISGIGLAGGGGAH